MAAHETKGRKGGKRYQGPGTGHIRDLPSALSNIIVKYHSIYNVRLYPSHLVKEGQLGWEMQKNEIPKKEMRRAYISSPI